MTDAAETVKKTAEKVQAQVKSQAEAVQAAGATAFREGVDKSIASLSELSAHGKKNLEAVVESASAAQKGVEALSQQGLTFAKKSWEDGVAAAQSASQARSIQELIELQTQWSRSALEAYLAEANKAAETFAASVKDSLQPLNARVTDAVERFQSAR
jgi:phasin family protein